MTTLRTAAVALALASAVFAAPAMPGSRAAAPPLQGEVLEVRDAPPYTYLRLKTSAGETWAAVTAAPVKKGAKVTIVNPLEMRDFDSKALGRRFDRVVFGTVADGQATTAGAAPAAGTMAAPRPAAPMVGRIAKASGSDARTVEEVVRGKATLKDKPVAVRAQVVKVNNGIMGKNWIHVQDGSGQAAQGTHDILVTSQDQVAVGDVVTINGRVRTDVELGQGYSYAVMIDGATLRK